MNTYNPRGLAEALLAFGNLTGIYLTHPNE